MPKSPARCLIENVNSGARIALWAATLILCGQVASRSEGAGSLYPIENDDLVSMDSVTNFELASRDLVFAGKQPDDFLRAVREVLRDPRFNFQLRIKRREQDSLHGIAYGLRTQTTQLPKHTHWILLFPSEWEVWIQILITMRTEPETEKQLVTVRYAVGERPDSQSGLVQLESYPPATDLVKSLTSALQAKFNSLAP